MKTCPECQSLSHDAATACGQCGRAFVVPRGTAEKPDPAIGTVIKGNFRIIQKIGSGAMGAIYLAEQESLGRKVVIKLLHRHLLADESLLNRFQREAHAAARLKHPNTIDIIEFGQTEAGALYIAMEYIQGQDLADVLHEQWPLGPARIIRILKQVCLALDQAHEKGIIHRDLKPENIMLERRKNEPDFVKVLDFGIAKIQDPERKGDRWQTMAGLVCGTPEYMAPEQARGEVLDARADLYALGIILYQLLTNTLPFTGDSPIVVVTRHLTDPVDPPSNRVPDVHPGLEALTLRMTDKFRDGRPGSAMEVYEALSALETDVPRDPTSTSGSFRFPPAAPAAAAPAKSPYDAATHMFDLHAAIRKQRTPAETSIHLAAQRQKRGLVLAVAAVLAVVGAVATYALTRPPPPVTPPAAPVAAAPSGSGGAVPSVASGHPASGAAVPSVAPGGDTQLPPKATPVPAVAPGSGHVAPSPLPVSEAPTCERRTEEFGDTIRERRPIALLDVAAAVPAVPAIPEVIKKPDVHRKPDVVKKPDVVVKPGTLTPEAQAKKEADAKAATVRAEQAKVSGQWALAAREYSAAYALRPQPGLLKKMGYMYMKAGQNDPGCKAFQRYVKGLSADQRPSAVADLSAYGCSLSM